MNRLLASTSLVVLALMTAPSMAQTRSPGPAADQTPAPIAQPAAPGAAIAPAMPMRASPTVAPAAAAPAAMAPPAGQSAASPSTAPSATQRFSEADTARLVGRSVRNAAEENVGEITSVVIGRDGSVSSVIVGVGGFLGIGQREVAIRWQDLQVADNGAIVHTTVTREQLAALPEYRYAENQRAGVVTTSPAATNPASAQPFTAPAGEAASVTGRMSVNDLIGASVRGPGNDALGRVHDILVDGNGSVRAVVVSSGGVLGIGDRRVEVPYGEVRVVRDGSSLNVVTRLTAQQLAQVAEYAPSAR